MEHLVRELSLLLQEPLFDPFASESIIVHSPGMERYIQLNVSLQNGIAANLKFLYPNRFLLDLLKRVNSQPFPFDPAHMTFRIMAALRSMLTDTRYNDELKAVQAYIPDHHQFRLYQLAGQTANLFDRYIIHRYEMLEKWNVGEFSENIGDPIWQSLLWKEIFNQDDGFNPLNLIQELSGRMDREWLLSSIPSGRLILFGISHLPPLHVDIIEQIAQFCDVHLFHLTPETVSLSTRESSFDWFLTRILQSTSPENIRQNISQNKNDITIRLHSCHTELREVEVLKDAILEALDSNADMKTSDFLVMTTDIERYAPFIEAVFGSGGENDLAYSIADRHPVKEKEAYDLLESLFDFVGGRFTFTEVFAFLEIPMVQSAFEFSPDQIDDLQNLYRKNNARWAYHREMKARFALPETKENTFRHATERMLLGSLLPGEEELLWKDILTSPDLEGESLNTVGTFVELLDRLYYFYTKMNESLSGEEWKHLLKDALTLLATDRVNFENLTKVLDGLARWPVKAGYDEPLEMNVIRREIALRFTEMKYGYGFLAGGITFCAMMPMRSIPFRFIGILGLNEGVFPARETLPSFDLIMKYPRPSDRHRQEDDRRLFRETILSSREYLHLSHIGKDIHDNQTRPRSILLDELEEHFSKTDSHNELLTYHHRIHPFHHAYFSGDGKLPIGYDRRAFEASRFSLQNRTDMNPFIDPSLNYSEPMQIDTDIREVSLEQMVRFFMNPARYFLQNTAGIRAEYFRVENKNEEPFLLDGLDSYRLFSMGLRELLPDGGASEETSGSLTELIHNMKQKTAEYFRKKGELPEQKMGDVALERIHSDIELLVSHLEGKPIVTRSVRIAGEINADPVRILLDMDRVLMFQSENHIHIHPSKFRKHHIFLPALIHLLISANGEHSGSTILYFKGDSSGIRKITLSEISSDRAAEHLRDLLFVFLEGEKTPLPFFPETSYKYYIELTKRKDDPLVSAYRTFTDCHMICESEDPSVSLAFRSVDLFQDPHYSEYFKKLSVTIYEIMDSLIPGGLPR